MNTPTTLSWTAVCAVDDILPNTGVCALVGHHPVAVFRVTAAGQPERFHAIDNIDPKNGANVLSRGLIGSLGDRVVVASPLYKHHFDLTTGACQEAPELRVRTYPVEVRDGQVRVAMALAAAGA